MSRCVPHFFLISGSRGSTVCLIISGAEAAWVVPFMTHHVPLVSLTISGAAVWEVPRVFLGFWGFGGCLRGGTQAEAPPLSVLRRRKHDSPISMPQKIDRSRSGCVGEEGVGARKQRHHPFEFYEEGNMIVQS
eukprot:1161873-Pelagomonas_calceolata.AAC.7